MTIEYKDSKRIVALSTESLLTSSDYTSSNFTTVGSTVAITNNSVVFSSTPCNADNGQHEQITALAESDVWSLDFIVNNSSGNTYDNVFLGLSSGSSAWQTSGQNEIKLQTQGTGYMRFTLTTRISGSNSQTASSNNSYSYGTDYYCTLSSDGTDITFKVWTNSGRTGTASVTLTRPVSGLGTMNYIQHRSRNAGDSNTWSGTVSEVALSRTPAKPTNVQDNSILVEKDTANRYWFSKPTTFEQNFDSNTGHTANQTTVNGWYAEDYTKIAYDGTNHYLKYAAMGSTNWGASFDLQQSGNNGVGSAINSSKWTLRFKWHILTNSGSTGNGSQGAFGISSVPATTLNNQDFMGFSMRQHASGGEVGLFNAALDNNNPMNQGTSAKKFVTGNLSAGTTYYAEIIRDGDKCTTTLRTGSHTGTQVGSMERTVTNISGLRYLYYKAQQDSGSATHTSYIDDIDFINGADTWNDDMTGVTGALTLDNWAGETVQTTATTRTFSYTITASAKEKKMLVVMITGGGSTLNVTSLTYGGQALTFLEKADSGSYHEDMEIWYMLNPPTGTADISATQSGSTNMSIRSCLSVYGVKQSAPLHSMTGGYLPISNGITSAITPTVAGSWVFSSLTGSNPTNSTNDPPSTYYTNAELTILNSDTSVTKKKYGLKKTPTIGSSNSVQMYFKHGANNNSQPVTLGVVVLEPLE